MLRQVEDAALHAYGVADKDDRADIGGLWDGSNESFVELMDEGKFLATHGFGFAHISETDPLPAYSYHISLNGGQWKVLTASERLLVLAHELYHAMLREQGCAGGKRDHYNGVLDPDDMYQYNLRVIGLVEKMQLLLKRKNDIFPVGVGPNVIRDANLDEMKAFAKKITR